MTDAVTAMPDKPLRSLGQASFSAAWEAWLTAFTDLTVDEINAAVVLMNANAATAADSVTDASAFAAAASVSALAASAAALAAGAAVWVSGATYPTTGSSSVVYDPNDYLCYRRIVAGAGTTPPSLDDINWARVTASAAPTVVVITASGTWTCPAHIRKAKVTVVGGGASSTTCSTRVGLGGGAGGTAIKTLVVSPGTVYTATIGAGGAAPTGANTNSVGGGTSSFAGSGISTVSATGGNAALYTELWASGGMGSGGDINMQGGGVMVMPGTGASRCPAMGGSSSMGGATRFGEDATGYGCGGGGSLENSSSGFAGKAGVIVIEY